MMASQVGSAWLQAQHRCLLFQAKMRQPVSKALELLAELGIAACRMLQAIEATRLCAHTMVYLVSAGVQAW